MIDEDSDKKNLNEKEKLSRKKVVELARFEFEVIAIITIVFGLFPIDLEDITIIIGISISIILAFSVLVWFYIIVKIFYGFFIEKCVSERSIEIAYKIIISQIVIISFGLPIIIAGKDFFPWGLVLGFVVHIIMTSITVCVLIFDFFSKKDKSGK